MPQFLFYFSFFLFAPSYATVENSNCCTVSETAESFVLYNDIKCVCLMVVNYLVYLLYIILLSFLKIVIIIMIMCFGYFLAIILFMFSNLIIYWNFR